MANYFNRKELIYTVYRQQSIYKAAQKLYISQPSLSVMIKKIEDEIGTPLFDRSTKPIGLTEAGAEYIRATEEIMHIEKSFENYINAVNDLQSGSLNLGSNQLLSSLVLPKYVSKFIRKYPKIHLNLVDDNSRNLESLIQAGQLDLIIDNQKMDPEIFEQRFVKEEHLLLAVPLSYACNKGMEAYRLNDKDILLGKHLSAWAPPVSLEQFRHVPFVMMTRNNETRYRCDEIFKEAEIKPNTILELDRLVTLYNFVEMGTAASIVSDTLVQNIQHHSDSVVFYRLASDYAVREIYVSYKRNKYYSKAMEAFIEIISDLQ